MTEKEVAELLVNRAAHTKTLALSKKGPAYYKLGGAVRYRQSELKDFISFTY